jgi:hypothetical protein
LPSWRHRSLTVVVQLLDRLALVQGWRLRERRQLLARQRVLAQDRADSLAAARTELPERVDKHNQEVVGRVGNQLVAVGPHMADSQLVVGPHMADSQLVVVGLRMVDSQLVVELAQLRREDKKEELGPVLVLGAAPLAIS